MIIDGTKLDFGGGFKVAEDMLLAFKENCSSAERMKFSLEMLPFAMTWMDLEGMMLSEISQKEKDKYCVISLTCGIPPVKKQTNKKEADSQIQRTN